MTIDTNGNSIDRKILDYLRLTSIRGRSENEIFKLISDELGIPAKQAEESIKLLRVNKRIRLIRLSVYFPEAKRAEDSISLKPVPLGEPVRSKNGTHDRTSILRDPYTEAVDLQKLYKPIYRELAVQVPPGKLEMKPPETITGRQCPKCGSNSVRCLGPISDMRDLTRRVRYRCARCDRTFSENV